MRSMDYLCDAWAEQAMQEAKDALERAETAEEKAAAEAAIKRERRLQAEADWADCLSEMQR